MKSHNKTRWILAYISFRFFLGGVEEFLILPTCWTYIHQLGGTIPWLGAVAAAYAIGAALFSPVLGRLVRKFRYIYVIMVLASFVKFIASMIYSIPFSLLYPLFGRFISGMADSCDGAIYSAISKYTDAVDRLQYALVFDGIFTIGTAFGAIVCSSLTINENIFGWPKWSIGIGNSPGFILTVIWFIFFTLTLCLPCVFEIEIATAVKERTISSGSEILQLQEKSSAGTLHLLSEESSSDDEQDEHPKTDPRIFCLLYLTFSTMFFSSTASILPSLIAKQLFHFKVIDIKLLFVNGTMTLIVLFLLIALCERLFQERTILATLLSLQLPPLVILLLMATSWAHVTYAECYLLVIYMCLGLPYFGFSICGSLLTKIIDEDQFTNTYQPVLVTVVQVAIISSRLTLGFVFTKTALICFGSVLIAMWLVGVVWFSVLFKDLSTEKLRYY